MSAKIKTCKRSWIHRLHILQYKTLPKVASTKGRDPVTINSSSIKTLHAEFHYVHHVTAKWVISIENYNSVKITESSI